MPGGRGNIDHIVIGSFGVTVIDVKRYRGRISVERRGGLLGARTEHLVVRGRDRTKLIDGLLRQAAAVREVLAGQSKGDIDPRLVLDRSCDLEPRTPRSGLPGAAGLRFRGRRGPRRDHPKPASKASAYGSLNEVISVSAAGPRWALERRIPRWNEPKLIRCPSNDADGALVGITIVNARALVDRDGSIRITLPETISAADIAPAFVDV